MSFATRRPKIGLECRPPPLMCRAPSSSSLTVRWWQGGTAARAAPPQRAMPKALRSGLTRRWTHGLRRLRGTRAARGDIEGGEERGRAVPGRLFSSTQSTSARSGGFEPWACRRRRSRTTMGTAPPGAPARPEASPSCGPAATSPGSPRCLLAEAPGRITPVPLVPTHQMLVPQSKMWLTPQLSHNRIDAYSLARRKAKHTDVAWKKEHGAVHEATAEPIDWWRPSVRQLGRD